jgi:hypothetical protein
MNTDKSGSVRRVSVFENFVYCKELRRKPSRYIAVYHLCNHSQSKVDTALVRLVEQREGYVLLYLGWTKCRYKTSDNILSFLTPDFVFTLC